MSEGDDYYNVDAFLAEEDCIPVKFRYDAYSLGYLHNAKPDADIKAHETVSLRSWLATALFDKNFIVPLRPDAFRATTQARLYAEPDTISLGKERYYYEKGIRIAKMLMKGDDIPGNMKHAFANRISMIIHWADEVRKDAQSKEVLRKLCSMELSLYADIHFKAIQYDTWRRRDKPRLEASPWIEPLGKRKSQT